MEEGRRLLGPGAVAAVVGLLSFSLGKACRVGCVWVASEQKQGCLASGTQDLHRAPIDARTHSLVIPAADLTSLRPQSELVVLVRPNNGQMERSFPGF